MNKKSYNNNNNKRISFNNQYYNNNRNNNNNRIIVSNFNKLLVQYKTNKKFCKINLLTSFKTVKTEVFKIYYTI